MWLTENEIAKTLIPRLSNNVILIIKAIIPEITEVYATNFPLPHATRLWLLREKKIIPTTPKENQPKISPVGMIADSKNFP